MTLVGPWLDQNWKNGTDGLFVLRHSIFINKTSDWDMDFNNSIAYCPQEICYRDGLTWWGWANSLFTWADISQGLKALQMRYLYSLSPDPNQNCDYCKPFLDSSSRLPNPATQTCIDVVFFEAQKWVLCVDRADGWGPTWLAGLIVGATFLCLLISSLAYLVLRSRSQAVRFLKQQVKTNSELHAAKTEAEERRCQVEEEKKRMEALIQRQHELISLIGDKDGSMSLTSTSTNMARDKIEDMKRQLSKFKTGESSLQSDICLVELLGEGSFGKVRGLNLLAWLVFSHSDQPYP
jgi:hypothetical protein